MIYLLLALTTIVIICVNMIHAVYRKRNLPPGPFRWPILGNVIEMKCANSDYPHLALAKLAKKYGTIMSLGFGSTYSVVISGYDELSHILKKPEVCEYRFEFPYVRDRSFGQSLGVIWSGGDVWRRMRRFTVRSLREFGFGKKKSMDAIINFEAEVIQEDIRRSMLENNGVWKVDPHYLSAAALNVLWRMVGGERFEANDEKLLENLKLNEEFARIVGHNNIYNTFPILKRLFPKLVKHDVHMKTHRGIQEWIKGLVEGTKVKRAERVDTDAQSFVEVFLDQIESNKGIRSDFTEEQLIVTLYDLFFAGAETTSMTLNWTILFLTLHPEKQKILQRKIMEATRKSLDLNALPYIRAVLLEVSRMGVVNPVSAPRLTTADIHYKNYLIPKGTCLYGNLSPIFTDERIWGDPTVFRPERFLDNTGAIIPQLEEKIAIFGFGTRRCIGDSLALDSLTKFIIELFSNFTFESIKGKEPTPKNPIAALTMKPRTYSVRVVEN